MSDTSKGIRTLEIRMAREGAKSRDANIFGQVYASCYIQYRKNGDNHDFAHKYACQMGWEAVRAFNDKEYKDTI